nr:MAG TPA: hypothetical protein [Caudoviricetes sp.]
MLSILYQIILFFQYVPFMGHFIRYTLVGR